VPLENPLRLALPEAPQGGAAVLARRREAAVRQRRGRVHRALVEAKHREGRAPVDIPQDGGLVEGARDGETAVRRHRERPHGAAMAPQFGGGREGAQDGGEEDGEAGRHR
jgi:hypothetical protein